MWETQHIPGYAEAIASERADRALVFCGLPEKISGVAVAPLTPRRVEWLRLVNNPLLIGGRKIEDADVIQFLWLVSGDFKQGAENRKAFEDAIPDGFDIDDAEDAIETYLDRAFLDSPQPGLRKSRPYYEPAADLITAMALPPFGWEENKTLDSPLSLIYQLIKCRDRMEGQVVVNRRSDRVIGDWLKDGIVVITEDSEEKLRNRVDEMAEEFEPVSTPSPHCLGGRIEEATAWSIAMQRKPGVTRE